MGMGITRIPPEHFRPFTFEIYNTHIKKHPHDLETSQHLRPAHHLSSGGLCPGLCGSRPVSDKFPNDWLEALIVMVAGIGVLGGFASLVYLYHLNQAL